MGKNRDKLSDTLTDQQKETLTKYDEVINEMHSIAEVEAFSYDLRIGVRLMVEMRGTLISWQKCKRRGIRFASA